jgi:flavin-dependent dehydrogenase
MTFDALVIGGGPAGCAAAIRLAQLGRTVAMAEGGRGAFKIGESLPPAVKPLLAELDALGACEGALTSFGNQSAWGSERLEDTDFIRDPNGSGWHVDRLCFEARLRSVATEKGATLLKPVRVSALERNDAGWAATLQSAGDTVSARWIVDCTGRDSCFAQSRKARRIHLDRLVAVVALFQCPDANAGHDRDSRTLVESAEMGWWYTSLIPGGRRVVVFHTDPEAPSFRFARSGEGFLQLLDDTRHARARISDYGYRAAGPLRVFQANSSRLDPIIGDGWLAAGDAAAAFDPLSSQGILTALYSGMHGAETVHASLYGDRDAEERYRKIVSDVFDAYLQNRGRYYGLERRWVNSPFWQSRLLLPGKDRII